MHESEVRSTVLSMMMIGANPSDVITALFHTYDSSKQMKIFIEMLQDGVEFNDKFGSDRWKGKKE